MPRRIYPDLMAYFGQSQEDTQAAVAKELGIADSLLSEIKWRKREPNIELALKIVERCNVPLESLIKPRNRRKAS